MFLDDGQCQEVNITLTLGAFFRFYFQSYPFALNNSYLQHYTAWFLLTTLQDLQAAVDEANAARNMAEQAAERANRKIKDLNGEKADLQKAFEMVCFLAFSSAEKLFFHSRFSILFVCIHKFIYDEHY